MPDGWLRERSMNISTTRVDSDGVGLHVVMYGDSKKVPVLLVHGYPDNHLVWEPVAKRLAQRFFVIAYDVRGAGQSDAPVAVEDYRLPVLARDLAAVVNAVIPDRHFHLAAHDWGSIQTWESVTTDRLKPRIASFTSISGPSLDHASFWIRDRAAAPSLATKIRVARQLMSTWYIGFFQLPVLPAAAWRAGVGRYWPTFLQKREGVGRAITQSYPDRRWSAWCETVSRQLYCQVAATRKALCSMPRAAAGAHGR
jgi:pimeloyl-ACP methyl ester carboxylesterase